ncbi:MAG: hypothetical protein LBB87_01045 [Nitrososphaerota archaeon]|nr:hypothetical protein [Nitrososphaerota archaeon]
MNSKKKSNNKEDVNSDLFTFVRASDLPLKKKKDPVVTDLSEEQQTPMPSSLRVAKACSLVYCEFVLAPVYQGASGRTCSLDKSICPERLYADKELFLNCFLRKREFIYQKKKIREKNKVFEGV